MGNFLGCKCEEKGDTPLVEIKQKRSCTDVPILLAFIGLWVVVIALISAAIGKGADPNKLLHAVDWNSKICGVHDEVKDKPYGAWPKIPLTSKLFGVMVCVKSCNETSMGGVFSYIPTGSEPPQPFGYPSSPFLSYCLPVNNDGSSMEIAGFNGLAQSFGRAIGDLDLTKDIIGYSALIAVALAFFFIWLIKRFAGVLVWLSILVVLAGGALLGIALFQLAQNSKGTLNEDTTRTQTLEYSSYAVFGLTALFFIVIVALRKRIKIAIEIVKEASKSIGYLPSMVFFPIFPFILVIGYFAFWLIGALYIFSVTTNTSVPLADIDSAIAAKAGAPVDIVQQQWDESMQQTFAVHFFHLLWNVQFFIYFGYMVIAGCVANWYFTPYGENGKKSRGTQPGQLPRSAVRRSVKRTIRYHLGTVAFGALLIAIVQFIRAIMKYIEKSAKGKPNRLRKALFCMIQCCLKCLQCCLDKLSKNAFIYCAIYGDPFCTSAWSSFAILWRNIARVAAINLVGNYICILGKLLVSLGSTGIVIQILTTAEPYKSELSSPILTSVLVFLLSYVIASIFMIVYETAVDTIFLCFLIDEEQNKNGQMLASKSLLAIINKYQAKSDVKAEGH